MITSKHLNDFFILSSIVFINDKRLIIPFEDASVISLSLLTISGYDSFYETSESKLLWTALLTADFLYPRLLLDYPESSMALRVRLFVLLILFINKDIFLFTFNILKIMINKTSNSFSFKFVFVYII